MPEIGTNLYQKARKTDHLTQEQAAQLLHVSETTLKEWELGRRVPDNQMVARMADAYHTPWLRGERALEIFAELGITKAGTAPENLQTATLGHYALLLDLMDGYRRFIQIAADGVIDENEEADYEIIQHVLLKNCVAGLRLACCQKGTKKERPDVPASKRSVQGLRRELSQNQYSMFSVSKSSPNFTKAGGECS